MSANFLVQRPVDTVDTRVHDLEVRILHCHRAELPGRAESFKVVAALDSLREEGEHHLAELGKHSANVADVLQ